MTVVVFSYRVFSMTPTEQPKQPKRPFSEVPRRGTYLNQKELQVAGTYKAGDEHPVFEGLLFWSHRSCGNQRWATEEYFEKSRAQERAWASSPSGRAMRASTQAKRRKTLNNNIKLPQDVLDALRDVYHTASDMTLAERAAGSSEEFHVDHIYPLRPAPINFNGTVQRPYVGLHAPWNLQIIEKSENLSKSNQTPEQ